MILLNGCAAFLAKAIGKYRDINSLQKFIAQRYGYAEAMVNWWMRKHELRKL